MSIQIVANLLVAAIIMMIFAGWILLVSRAHSRQIEAKLDAPEQVRAWATQNNFQIRAMQQKDRFTGMIMFRYGGPFHARTNIEQVVYRVVVTKIGEEKRRVAWIQVGKGAWDDFAEDFKVIWEDEWRPQEPLAS